MLVTEWRCPSCGTNGAPTTPVPPNLELPATFGVEFLCRNGHRWLTAGADVEGDTLLLSADDWRHDDAPMLQEPSEE